MTQDPASAASPAAIAPGAAAPTVGSALRALRQAKGWSLEEVSSRIKFSTRMIQALEERWESLPRACRCAAWCATTPACWAPTPRPWSICSISRRHRTPAPARPAPRGGQGLRPAGVNISVDDERSSGSWGWLLAILVVVAAAVAYAFGKAGCRRSGCRRNGFLR